MKNIKDEKGLASVEAAISLTIFVLAFLAILSIIHMCYVEARVNSALCHAAKEMSQYSYFYDLIGADDAVAAMRNNSETIVNAFSTFTTAMDDTTTAISSSTSELNSLIENGFSADNFKNGIGTLQNSYSTISANIKSVEETIMAAKSDPKTYLVSLAAWAGGKLADEANNIMAACLSRAMTARHFESTDLEKLGVAGGFDGINFKNSSMFTEAEPKVIRIVVVYELKLADYIPFDISITISQSAVTRAWFGDR